MLNKDNTCFDGESPISKAVVPIHQLIEEQGQHLY